jgi:hypothetical protein
MEAIHHFAGSCHCGAIAMALAFTGDAAATQVRSCQCSFCRRQGAVTISDPNGRAVIEIDTSHVAAYQFATATAKSLICTRCGVYAGALLQADDGIWSIANTRGLAIPEFEGRVGTAMTYEHEAPHERIARRKQRWTPTELKLKV